VYRYFDYYLCLVPKYNNNVIIDSFTRKHTHTHVILIDLRDLMCAQSASKRYSGLVVSNVIFIFFNRNILYLHIIFIFVQRTFVYYCDIYIYYICIYSGSRTGTNNVITIISMPIYVYCVDSIILGLKSNINHVHLTDYS